MLTLETLSENDVRKAIPHSSLSKAYGLRSRVMQPTRIGDRQLTAQVQGNTTYRVEIELTDNQISATCTCPQAYTGACKHIGAVLLKWLGSPHTFALKPAPVRSAEEQAAGIRVFTIEPPATTIPKEPPFWLKKPFAARLADDHQQTVNAFNLFKLDELRQLAKERGWVVKGTRKEDVINQLLAQMTEPGQNLRALAQLDNEHLRALWSVAILGDFTTTQLDHLERLASAWGKLHQYSKFATYLRHLATPGLIILNETQHYYGTRLAFIPRPLIRSFPPLLADALPHGASIEAAAGTTELQLADAEGVAPLALQILLLLEQIPTPLRTPMPRPQLEKSYRNLEQWDYVPAELKPLESLAKNRTYQEVWLTIPPPQPALPDLATEQLLPLTHNSAQLEFILALLGEAGLLQPGSPVTVWRSTKEAFLRQPSAVQRAILIHTYFRLLGWTELWEVVRTQPALRLTRRWTTYGNELAPQALQAELAACRRLILQTLAWLPDNEWIKVEDLFKVLQAVWPQFDQSQWLHHGYGHQVTWRLSKDGQPLDKNDLQSWLLAQGNFVLTMLRGPLFWLGLVDLASHNGVVTHLRLHGLADLYWDRSESIEPPAYASSNGAKSPAAPVRPPAEALQLEGDLLHVRPSAIRAQAHNLLDRIAKLESAQPQHFVYRLDATATHQTFERGGTLDELVAEWQQQLGEPMPVAIRERLENWWHAYGRVRLYKDVTIIEFGDDYALKEMKAVTSLAQVMIAEISPRLVLIPQSAIKDLTAELEKAGYTPQQTENTD